MICRKNAVVSFKCVEKEEGAHLISTETGWENGGFIWFFQKDLTQKSQMSLCGILANSKEEHTFLISLVAPCTLEGPWHLAQKGLGQMKRFHSYPRSAMELMGRNGGSIWKCHLGMLLPEYSPSTPSPHRALTPLHSPWDYMDFTKTHRHRRRLLAGNWVCRQLLKLIRKPQWAKYSDSYFPKNHAPSMLSEK